MRATIEAAVAHQVALEINGAPFRLDLNEEHCRIARAMGARFVISSDSHQWEPGDIERLVAGAAVAHDADIRSADILNTRPVEELVTVHGESGRSEGAG